MRDTTVSPEDLAIESAKQKLALIKDRPGYLEAMHPKSSLATERSVLIGGAAASAAIAYACWHYVTAAWLMWLLIVLFGAFALLLLFAMIGFSQKHEHWGAAVIGRRISDGERMIAFLSEGGERREISVDESLYDVLRPGDVGVVTTTGKGKYIEAFERL